MGGNTPVLVRLSGYSDKCRTIHLHGVITYEPSCNKLTLVVCMVVSDLCSQIGGVGSDLRWVYSRIP